MYCDDVAPDEMLLVVVDAILCLGDVGEENDIADCTRRCDREDMGGVALPGTEAARGGGAGKSGEER